MVDRSINKTDELKQLKGYLKLLNQDMRYYINIVQEIEREMEDINRLIHDIVVEDQDY